MKSKYALRFLALGYLALLLGIPVALVFINAFQDGVGAAWDAVTTPEAQHAFWMTFIMVIVAVPLNTIFGVLCALAIVRREAAPGDVCALMAPAERDELRQQRGDHARDVLVHEDLHARVVALERVLERERDPEAGADRRERAPLRLRLARGRRCGL